MADVAVSDDDVLRRAIHAQSVGIAARFETDAVVIAVNIAAADQDIACRINIYAVGTRCLHGSVRRAHRQMADLDAVAIGQLEVPKGGVFEKEVTHYDVLATDEVDQPGPANFEMRVHVILLLLARLPIFAPPTLA